MYFLYRPFVYLYVLTGYVFDKFNGLRVVDGLQMFTHGLAGDGYALIHHERGFLQGECVPLDAVAFVGIFNVQGFLYLF